MFLKFHIVYPSFYQLHIIRQFVSLKRRFSKCGLGNPKIPKTFSEDLQGQTHFRNNTKTLFAFLLSLSHDYLEYKFISKDSDSTLQVTFKETTSCDVLVFIKEEYHSYLKRLLKYSFLFQLHFCEARFSSYILTERTSQQIECRRRYENLADFS